MAYEKCPQCGSDKHQLMACSACGFTRLQHSKAYKTRTSNRHSEKACSDTRKVCETLPCDFDKLGALTHHKRSTKTTEPARGVANRKNRKKGATKRRRLSRTEILKQERIRSRLVVKKKDETLTPEQMSAREKIQKQGFHEGARVPGSSVRKIER